MEVNNLAGMYKIRRNFNSTKVQFGAIKGLAETSSLVISIPLRYNLESTSRTKTARRSAISIPLRYNLEGL